MSETPQYAQDPDRAPDRQHLNDSPDYTLPRRRRRRHVDLDEIGPQEAINRPRSSRLCYECSRVGSLGEGTDKIECRLRPSLIGQDVDPDLSVKFPDKMWYPRWDHLAAHAMVDAVVEGDIDYLLELMKVSPCHEWGFEGYLDWVRRHHVVLRQGIRKKAFSKPLTAKVIGHDLITSLPVDELHLDFNVLRFADGDAWGELIWRKDKMTLTRGLMELISGRVQISHHYPGRYRALKKDPRKYLKILKDRKNALRLIRPDREIRTYTAHGVR